jgi:alpha/beta superfamily hydrolase
MPAVDLSELLEPLDIPPQRRGPWIAAGVVGVLVIGVLVMAALRPEGQAASAPATTAVGAAAPVEDASAPGPAVDAAPTTTVPDGPPDLTGDPPPFTEVTIATDDGAELAGLIFDGGAHGVLIAHPPDTGSGGPANAEAILPIGVGFARAGYTVLMFDHRGHGRSAGESSADRLAADLASAYRFLVDRQVDDIDVFTWGTSGTAAVMAAADGTIGPGAIVAVFARPQYLGMDALSAIGDTEQRYLFVSVDAGRSTQWARRLVGAAPEGAASLVELPAPPAGADPVTGFWADVVGEALTFLAEE